MFPAFASYIITSAGLSPGEVEQVCSLAQHKTLQRNEPLLLQGQICRHKTFIVKGLLRTYAIAEDGSEHILQFSPENSWTLDVESYDQQAPSRFNITAVESTEVLQWNRPDFEQLLATLPKLKTFSQQLISRNIYSSRQRLLTTLSATPEEKYEDFVRTSPNLLQRLPLRMIASYLGISLKTLTRIRHAQLHR